MSGFGFEFGTTERGLEVPIPGIEEEGDAETDSAPVFEEGDIVAMPYNGKGVLGYIKAATGGYVTAVPLQLRKDGVWVKQGKARTTRETRIFTKIPGTLTGMKVRI